jgi:mono/diheme cytochrome c family protein
LLPVLLFIAFWVVLALIVFFVAGSGGARGAAETVSGRRGSMRAMGLLMVFVFVGFAVALPALFLHGNHANASSQIGGVKLTQAEKQGREIFAFRCGFCHTLAAANAAGKVGPNLDVLKPPKSLVLSTIQNGCLQNPPTPTSPAACLNQGNMPAGIIQGQEAEQVASFVAKVAGRE